MSWSPSLVRSVAPDGRLRVQLGHEVVDDFLEFAAGRCRPNMVLAAGFDLKTFFTVIDREPVEVVTADVLAFIRSQRASTGKSASSQSGSVMACVELTPAQNGG